MRTLFALLATVIVCHADAMDDLRVRWRLMLTGGVDPDTTLSQVRSRLTSVQSAANRDWTSLQKTNPRPALWTDLTSTTISAQVSSNYSRLRGLALGWATPGQPLYQNEALRTDIVAALDWLDANRYSSRSKIYDNWWDWEIGTPNLLNDIAILLYDTLSADQLTRYMAAIERFAYDPRVMLVDTSRIVATGANLADKAKIALLRGVLLKDEAKVRLAVSSLEPLFANVTRGDGFYDDGSFIQHTAHPYTGSYGLVLLGDMADLLYLLSGSQWDLSDAQRAAVYVWARDSFSPLLYKGAMMDMVRGRAISRNSSTDHGIGHSTMASMFRLSYALSDAHTQDDAASDLRSRIKGWLLQDTVLDFATGLPLDLVTAANRLLRDDAIVPAEVQPASHVFASMDRVVHVRPAWAAGIAMHSSRVYNYESINNENLKGWHTGDGMLYLYTSDLPQFMDSFWPSVDAQRLPGTTVVAGSTARQTQYGGSALVGGTSVDSYSAAMMQLSPDARQLSAKKSWFLFDDEIVALGADIRSTAAGKTVETVVENRRLGSDAAFVSAPAGEWAHLTNNHAGIGYYFPNGAGWQVLRERRTGMWRDWNAGGPTTVLNAEYQTLWFDHGATPSTGSYAYVVLPGRNAEDTAGYTTAPAVQIVRNDPAAQAVTHGPLGMTAANFWTSGGETAGLLRSDGVASVMLHQTNAAMNIAVADPTQTNTGTLHLEIAAAASEVLSSDSAVTVEQMTPTVKLAVDVRGSRGKTFRVSLTPAALQ